VFQVISLAVVVEQVQQRQELVVQAVLEMAHYKTQMLQVQFKILAVVAVVLGTTVLLVMAVQV
jgi:hypothetical protein